METQQTNSIETNFSSGWSFEEGSAAAARRRATWVVVVLYAIAMAWVESAVVLYLRTLGGNMEPNTPNTYPDIPRVAGTELVRELATLVMLCTVGCLAGRNWRSRIGYALVAFGIWDIWYYLFLKVLTGWPNSLLDWDLLFLLPLPWWGPVLAPVLIAGLMIAWGTLASQFERMPEPARGERKVFLWSLAGIVLALYVFMADALRVAGQGTEAIRNVLPGRFNWPLFCIALGFMALPVIKQLRRFERLAIR